jgi:DNA-binding GntR family transcriptional regulator
LILRILEGIWMRIGPVYALRQERPAPAGSSARQGQQLIDALRARDGEAARAAVVADIRRGSECLERALVNVV